MIARILYGLNSYLCRTRLERDPVWKALNDNERRARKAHGKCAAHQAAKRERINTALGWRGSR
jgi:hypothetical protein